MTRELVLLTAISLCFTACNKSDDPDEHANLVETLNQELLPMTEAPLLWSDTELSFLDEIGNKPIVGLGEATHGTAEFFKAKHRIFRYLVENHNYKVFAFEADFGESILINEAIQTGNCSAIEELMKSKMHFWTWRTEEVKALLQWMCVYNTGKPDTEKLQYVGVDCQFNTFHPDMVIDYLQATTPPFLAHAEELLTQAKTGTVDDFDGYSWPMFNQLLDQLESLEDSLTMYQNELIAVSSQKEFELNARILRLVRQVSHVVYNRDRQLQSNFRDLYMAENTTWFLDFFGEKIVSWAHNWHVADHVVGQTMGYHLKEEHGSDYSIIGFLFSKGSFTAVGHDGQNYTSLASQSISQEPQDNSINFLMSSSTEPLFSIEIDKLQEHTEWNNSLNDLRYFEIGAVFNPSQPGIYYQSFDSEYFDYIIYFDETTASRLIPF